MSIEAMKLALCALEAGTDSDLIGNARIALRAAIQQPATAIACGIPGMAKTTCPYCEQGFAFEHEQPATGEPVGQVSDLFPSVRNKLHAKGFDSDAPLYTHLAPIVPTATEPVASRNPFASRCYTMSESHLSGHRLIVGFEKLGDAQDAHEWVARQGRGDFTHPAPIVFLVRDVASLLGASVPDVCNALAELGYEPRRSTNAAISPDEAIAVAKRINPAPSVRDDVVRDAERYRWLRDNGVLGFSGAPSWRMYVSFDAMDAYAQTLDSNIDAATLAAKEGGAA